MTEMVFGAAPVRAGDPVIPRWWRTIDRVSLGLIVLLFGFGILLGLAASVPLAEKNNLPPYYYVTRQALFGGLAFAVMILCSMMPVDMVRRGGILGFAAAALSLILLPLLGTDFGKGAVRWYSLGFVSVQPSEFLKPGFVIISAWLMAEYFTAKRRMALPSIVFLLAFVGGAFATAATLLVPDGNVSNHDRVGMALVALSAAIAAGAAWLHWKRFMVPITIAAGAAACAGVALALLAAAYPKIDTIIYPLLLIAGLAIFGLAMRWDMTDRARTTRRSDVAFWLHLLAAPMIVHPAFVMLGIERGETSASLAGVVLAIYLALGAVALIIDRRALMVSALAYVLPAMGALFREFGAVSLNVAITALVIGSALLLLSAFWHDVRAMLVRQLPEGIQNRLPVLQTINLRPAS